MAAVPDSRTGGSDSEAATVKFTTAPIAHFSSLVNYLIEGGQYIVSELNFCNGKVALRRQSNREADDSLLAKRRIEDSVGSELGVQVLRAPEHSSKLHVLAKYVGAD